MSKTERINIRIDPAVKAQIEKIAKAERRSVASLIEIAVLEYGERRERERKGGR